ncbi:MAG TPA: MRP family ATP-binding protein [Planctomycetaceae bacterium]|nr:MRP family ATP-binding protein [Planctomycetaceae bacterium]
MTTDAAALDRIQSALADFPDPETGRSALKMKQIRDIEIAGEALSLTLALTTHSAAIREDVQAALEQEIRQQLPEYQQVTIQLATHDRPATALGQVGLTAKSVIAVGSGKGGVGKSTIACSLALALKAAGSKVGLMDADVYGPSIPHLMGATGKPEIVDKKITPVDADGLPLMSMGFLVPAGEAVVWRGPMLHGAILQFLRDTRWGDLDYLIIDMPPGTGDIALTLSQSLPLTGAVVVCTPQDVALIDAVKAIAMFQKVNISILGMVENMSGFVCPNCETEHDIFGIGGAEAQAREMKIPLLAKIPIHIPIRRHGDEGQTANNLQETSCQPWFESLARTLVQQLATASAATPPQPQLPILG